MAQAYLLNSFYFSIWIFIVVSAILLGVYTAKYPRGLSIFCFFTVWFLTTGEIIIYFSPPNLLLILGIMVFTDTFGFLFSMMATRYVARTFHRVTD